MHKSALSSLLYSLFPGANRQSHSSQVYISPALLNIPDVPPTMPPPRNSKISISLENITDLGHADTINPFNIDHKRDQGIARDIQHQSLHTCLMQCLIVLSVLIFSYTLCIK